MAEFFWIVGRWDVSDFQVLSPMEGGNQVTAEVVIEVHLANGGSYRDEELHLWTFDDAGKVSRLRHYTDTAKHIAAAAVPTRGREELRLIDPARRLRPALRRRFAGRARRRQGRAHG